jgi:hypothetical protein
VGLDVGVLEGTEIIGGLIEEDSEVGEDVGINGSEGDDWTGQDEGVGSVGFSVGKGKSEGPGKGQVWSST